MAFILRERNNTQLIEKTMNVFVIKKDGEVLDYFRKSKNQFGSKTREQILMEATMTFNLIAG